MTYDIEAIRQSPRQFVDLETVEWLSDRAIILEEQLAERKKQIVILRDVIEQLLDDMGEDGHCVCDAAKTWAKEALTATQDLAGLILCDAEPRSYLYKHNSAFGYGFIWSHRPLHNGQDALESLPLYKAKKP